MKDKSVQVRISRAEIETIVREVISKEIEKVIKKAKVDDEIRLAVNEAVIDVDLPAVKEKLIEFESRLKKVEKDGDKKD